MKEQNPFKYSNNNKRYHTLDYYYKTKYQTKIAKISLNIGCTCPNIDGTKGYGGCIYCKNKSGQFTQDPHLSLQEQYNIQKEKITKKWKDAKFIAYFQVGTNTYAPLPILKKYYEEALTLKDVIGIHIATRCDAITKECLNYLEELNQKTDLTIELGLQSIHEKTANFIHRGHTLEEFISMVNQLHNKNIKIVVHIINGLPYENKEQMIETAKFLNTLPIDGIKIHMLHILTDTPLAKIYQKKPFKVLTKEEYIDITIQQLEVLNEKIVIHRITGDPKKEELIAPNWLLKKFVVLNDIDKEMKKRNTFQGKYQIVKCPEKD